MVIGFLLEHIYLKSSEAAKQLSKEDLLLLAAAAE